MKSPLIFDVHLDLALNAVEWNRDLRLPLEEVRKTEAHLRDKAGRVGRDSRNRCVEFSTKTHAFCIATHGNSLLCGRARGRHLP